ncbi:MAG: hypothetical protein WBL39_19355 [Terrimicrobiaceae bacterium]
MPIGTIGWRRDGSSDGCGVEIGNWPAVIFQHYRSLVSRYTSVCNMTILCFTRQIALDLAVWSFCASTRMTAYHAKYFAHKLTKRCPSDSGGKLAASLPDAQVDLVDCMVALPASWN